MFARVLVLTLGLWGGITAGVLAGKWLSVASANSATIEQNRDSTNETAKKGLADVDQLSKTSYFLLAAVPLGIAGGILGGRGKGLIAAPLLLLAAAGPLYFSFSSIVASGCLAVAGFFALFARPPQHPSEEGVKGCWNALKGWLNIGGVKIRFQDVNPNVPKSGTAIIGKLTLSSKSDRHIFTVHYQLVRKRSKGKGEDKKSKDEVLGEAAQNLNLDMKAGQTQTLDFQLPYAFSKGLKDMGGMLGGVGKLAAFAMSEKDEFTLLAEADVAGSLFEPTNKLKIKMVD